MTYLLDTNVFIQARNQHYGFDICPGFWAWVDEANERGVVYSIDSVADELQDQELADWAAARRQSLFLPRDQATLDALPRVYDWIIGRQYRAAAIGEFMQDADYFLVGYALAHGYTVVSNESSAPEAKKRVQIPDVCLGVGVECIPTYAMLRRQKARFVLAPAQGAA